MSRSDDAATVRVAEADPAPAPSEMIDRRGMNEGMRVLAYLISGPLVYGGLGLLADRSFGTGIWVPVGVLLGTALSIYLIIRRYAREESA